MPILKKFQCDDCGGRSGGDMFYPLNDEWMRILGWTQDGNKVYCTECSKKRKETDVDEVISLFVDTLFLQPGTGGLHDHIVKEIEKLLLAQRKACAREVDFKAHDFSGIIKKTILSAEIKPGDFE